jgi:hypothetical protein
VKKPAAAAVPPVMFGRAAARAPEVGAAFRGIELRARPVDGRDGTASHWIDGVIQVGRADASALALTPIQRQLVLTVSAGYRFGSWNMAEGRVLFRDDQAEVGGVVRGPFAFDLARYFEVTGQAPCHVLVSAGPFLSEPLLLTTR